MSDLWKVPYNEGIEQGIALGMEQGIHQGIEQGVVNCIKQLCIKNGISTQQAMDLLDIDNSIRDHLISLLNE